MKKINFKDFSFKKLTKKHIAVLVSSVVVILVLASFTALIAVPSMKNEIINNSKEELFKLEYKYPESGLITASNGLDKSDKNSLIYINKAFSKGAECIEVDVAFSNDGTPYVAESTDKIDENTMPLEYLFSILSEDEDDDNNKHYLNMRLRGVTDLKKIDELAKSYDMTDYCFYTGVGVNQASFVRMNSEIKFYVDYELKAGKINDPRYAAEVMNEITKAGGIGINCSFDTFSTVFESIFKENWLKISFYGADDDLDIIKALKYAPNQIITNNPQAVRQILNEWSLNAPSSDIVQE